MQFPIHRENLLCREVEGELVILDRDNESIHQLNVTAGAVWKLCDGQHSPADIAAELVSAYGISMTTAEQDVSRTLTDFVERGLLANGTNLGG